VSLLIFFEKIERLAFPLVALGVAVLVWILPNLLTHTVQIVSLAAVVALLGLPHGALDPWIAKTMRVHNTRLHVFVFTSAYVLISMAVIVAWVWTPIVCLLVFLLISGWHFSGDWDQTLHWVWRRSLGFLLLLMPISFHTQEVAMLFWYLSGDGATAMVNSLVLPQWGVGLCMVIIAGVTFVQRQWPVAIEVLALLVLAFAAPPLVYFALYFCLLHSPRHMANIFRQVPATDHAKLIRMMCFYTAAAALGLGLLAWLWSAAPANTLLVRVVFVGLAAVTVPHMILIGAASWRLDRQQYR
jgi:Brp/Blh family beta-carotene 15,15'-monooxygenase